MAAVRRRRERAGECAALRALLQRHPRGCDGEERLYPVGERATRYATTLNPESAAAWLRLSQEALFAGQHTEAVQAYDKAGQLAPENEDVLRWGMEIFAPRWRDDPDRRAKTAQQLTTLPRPYGWQRLQLAEELEETGLSPQAQQVRAAAEKEISERLQQFPDDPQAHYDEGWRMLHHQIAMRRAPEEFAEVARLVPDDPLAILDHAVVLNLAIRHKQAAPALEEAIRQNPERTGLYAMLGESYWNLKNYKAAEQACREGLRHNPANQDAH